MRLSLSAVILLSVATSLGCLLPIVVRGAHSGVVVDQAAGEPVPGVEILVETWEIGQPTGNRLEKARTYRTRTDGHGRWSVPRSRGLWFGVPMPHVSPAYGHKWVFQSQDTRIGHSIPGQTILFVIHICLSLRNALSLSTTTSECR